MADIVPAEVRSRMMAGIRAHNTKPELTVRLGLHQLGFRYRVSPCNLPGRPDMVFPKYRAVIFVHGCFWHGHDCHLFKWPATRKDFWKTKITRNRERDVSVAMRLELEGWRVATVWECALKGKRRQELQTVIGTLAQWLQGECGKLEIQGHRHDRNT